ncbi:MAG TPA: ABC transporter permease, partial [bacterium]|nr:ABC transporter permease [bacterium]
MVIAVLGGILPAQAHWADLSVAEIVVGETRAEITLVFPTGLVSEADDNSDGQLSEAEVRAHAQRLQTIIGEKISLADGDRRGTLSVEPAENAPSP